MHKSNYITSFSTKQMDVHYFNEEMANAFQKYLVNNKDRLAPFEPLRTYEYYELNEVKKRIRATVNLQEKNKGVSLVFTPKNSSDIVGNINFTNFVFGVFQACHLGFSIDTSFEGKGVMREVLTESLKHIRNKYQLHRVMANHLPTNDRCAHLLQRIGFIKEGYAKSYLKINGVWQDHVLNSFVFED
ncbi:MULTISPECIES: GNAT family N-acetyltransferase [Xenorhabdus]|uniref:Ribosomal-protein-alanine N-acetyltransferase n=1 Tax=Xenorhabdus ehlersii TaxID=290111 RepID=A0A2D0IXH6_9GAMM|nr:MULTISPECIES: GNAT family N-acetyltransferase [Xenorhabdus]MBC8949993.1 ribosomal-protein-alanine acetyltransferase [Xenorhabdus sp. TS4]PHM26649.1 ribosomal-protein-alanine acetyltransferase [Xenorhabdus ehlersii]RKE93175.1 ribosomal-protein-alanine N-acetyltransferase [Xenorhabdus ehlersii]